MIFLERPISAAMLALAVLAMVFVVLPAVRSTRDKAFAE
jgi:putative tricarboxylic transport membrane protein